MPWEKKSEFWKWATDDSGMEQVGTVYTAQGFEFDYMAVIFGNDLVYDHPSQGWKAQPEHSHDSQVKRGNPNLVEHLKSVYRVLLSRAHKGMYVYFMDPGTRQYFERHLGQIHEAASLESLQFEILETVPEAQKYTTHLPVYSLAAAAGAFSEPQAVEPTGWSKVSAGRKLTADMFIAQVKGKSMEPTIPGGSYCIFRFERGGSRNGKIVLAQSRHISDPETGGQYTVKRYFSEKELFDDGTWRHKRITLAPENAKFKEIALQGIGPGDFRAVAEFVACIIS